MGRHMPSVSSPLPRNITVAWTLKRCTFAVELIVLMLRMAKLPRAMHAIREIDKVQQADPTTCLGRDLLQLVPISNEAVQKTSAITLAEVYR